MSHGFQRDFVSASEAVSVIQSGDRVWVHSGCAVPGVLVDAMVSRYTDLTDVEVVHLMGLHNAAYVRPEMEGHFRHNAFFVGRNVRDSVSEGRADVTPIFLSEVPALLCRRQFALDVALIQVSPPDEHGFCSFGVAVECTKAATNVAKVVIAQVNPRMPRTLGDSFIHISQIDYCVEADTPLLELPRPGSYEPDAEKEVFDNIGRHVAGLVEDGSTLQVGIGRIPDAILGHLEDRKNLGIHSEMVSDGIMSLVEKGVMTNKKKTLLPGKIVASFVLGSRKLFDFINDNPLMEFRPTDFTNDPFVISQNRKMVAMNSALAIDLSGQVSADSLGRNWYGGLGGLVDFLRGAARSEEGKPVVAFPSTAANGSRSRILPFHPQGAGITASRGDVHYVATEFGVVNLHGKTIRERAELLISIAHPSFRRELEDYAREHYYK